MVSGAIFLIGIHWGPCKCIHGYMTLCCNPICPFLAVHHIEFTGVNAITWCLIWLNFTNICFMVHHSRALDLLKLVFIVSSARWNEASSSLTRPDLLLFFPSSTLPPVFLSSSPAVLHRSTLNKDQRRVFRGGL